MVSLDDFMEGVIDVFEAVRDGRVGWGSDNAIVESLTATDNTEAADAGARVDAENAGGGRVGSEVGAGSETVGAGGGGWGAARSRFSVH